MDLCVAPLSEQFNGISKEDLEFVKKCTELCSDINSGRLSLVQLVEQLEPLLVNLSPEEREKGTLILSTVLESSPDALSATQLNYITTFYCTRLNDHHQVIPAVLKGLIPLVQFKNLPDGAVTQLLSSLFQNVPCQQQQQGDRYNIYLFFKMVLDKRKDEVKAMGFDFVFGIISAMDGERDPRNLLFLFNWLPQFLQTVDLGHLTEEMFEVMACYFPVDFRAPSQDPDSISRHTLAVALCPCLCAVPEFSSHCIPLALEKLDSELHTAKLDSLDLLVQGCLKFPADIYKQHSIEMWSLLQKQIINCKDHELESKSLLALTCIMRKLSHGDEEFFRKTIRDIIDTVKGNLRPDTKLFESSSKILISVAEAEQNAAIYVIKEVLPLLTNLYNITSTPSHQVAVFKALIDFVKTYLNSHETASLEELEDLKVIPNLCLKAVIHREQEVVAAGLDGLSVLAKHTPVEARNCFYEVLPNLLLARQSQDVQSSLLQCLRVFAQNYSSEILNLFSRIPVSNLESLKAYLEAVSFVASVEDLTKDCLQTIIFHLFKDQDSSCIALKILETLLENGSIEMQRYLLDEQDIVNRSVDWYLETFADGVCPILSLVIGNLDATRQASLVNGQLEKVLPLFKSSGNGNYVFLLYGLLCRVWPSVSVNSDVLKEVANVCLETDDAHVNEVCAQLLGNIVNKTTDDPTLYKYLKLIENKYSTALVNLEGDHHRVKCLINLTTFMTKALIMRSHKSGQVWTDKLFDLTEKYAEAAKGFYIVIDDSCDCFSTRSHCTRRLLYRQNFFTLVIKPLCENFKEKSDNYLLIVGYLLQGVPKQVLQLEIRKIVKLALMCLDRCDDPEVLHAVLTTVHGLLQEKDPIMENYLQEYLTRCLKLATFKKSMNVRVMALKCIALYAVYPIYKLLPLRDEVIFALAECLDDPKRLVRKEAVEARSMWFLIDFSI